MHDTISISDMSTPSQQVLAINKLHSTQSNNPTNSIFGSTDTIRDLMNGKVEPGKRDPIAGIQYYSVNQGVNRKTMIQPVIAPRITDQDYWGAGSTVRSDINRQNYRDITESDLDLNDMLDVNGRTRNSLGIPQVYQHRTKGADVEMNSIHDPDPFGDYPGGQADAYLQDRRDFNSQVLPIYKNKNNFPIMPVNKKEMECKIPGYNRSRDAQQQMDADETACYYDTEMHPSQDNPNDVETKGNRERFMRRMYHQYNTKQPLISGIPPVMEEDERQADVYPRNTEPTMSGYSNFVEQDALQNYFRNKGARIAPSQSYYNVKNRIPPGVDQQTTPVTDQLLKPAPAYVLNDKFFEQPNARLVLQDIQPKLYSYAVDPEPINSNIGITYAPQNPPKVLSQLADSSIYSAYPMISRIDPQLIRKEGTPGQLARNPVRTNWSEEYSNFQAAPGSINFEDIYDPRFNSYGDPYRSYTDINLGQVQYYYSDVDAYRRPNFITRSNVDFVEYTDPMGRVKPYYNRTASLDDVRAQVESERTADELFHRQDLMSSQMSKRNAELVQLRMYPKSRAANSSMPFGPT